MIAYNESLESFYQHVRAGVIENKVVERLGISIGESERRAFRNSLPAIANALQNAPLPGDVEVALEYRIPLTNKRVDFLLAGADSEGKDHLVVCELKQWEEVEHTDMSDIVLVGNQEHVHPSWQAYTYGSTISNFNEFIEINKIEVNMCTFLHNYQRRVAKELLNPIYLEGISKAEPFISDQYLDLARFISKYIKTKSKTNLMYEIDKGRIRPSKMLADALSSMLNGNDEYVLIDEQRVVYSNLLKEIQANQQKNEKQVFIVKGGAGTGKSLIAIRLLSALINNKGLKTFYVTKSGYVRENYFGKLTKGVPNYRYLKTLFKGSGSFIESINNDFDVLIVDEAHRLTQRTKQSWFYKGENQIKEIIHAAKTSIFFIDETQNIDIKDYGTIENIVKFANYERATVHNEEKYSLKSQFRCNGSDDYLAWLESFLYNKEYIASGELVNYDIRVFDDILEMKEKILAKNNASKVPSRMLSGDVFEWKSMNDKTAIDIVIDGFEAQWNKTKAFATDPKSIEEVGCIHTAQGMEFEYTGLIIGEDLIFRDGRVLTDYTQHPDGAGEFKRPHSRSIDPKDSIIIDRIIRNTYKVLMTRGQKGCYLYVMDQPLKEFIKKRIKYLAVKNSIHIE